MAFPNFSISDEIFMLENYGFEPLELMPQDGFCSYTFKSANNESLMFSFNRFERWFKILVSTSEHKNKVKLLIENAETLSLHEKMPDKLSIIGQAEYISGELVVSIQILPEISIDMSIVEIRKS